jgi:SAM-dependent methyltransferase
VTDVGSLNPLLDEFRKIEGDTWPIETASIDLLYADAVLEHLKEPDAFFAECSRVVKPGGYICFITPNKWAYYALIAALIPNRLHAKVISMVQPFRAERDIFPTYYRANTVRELKRLLKDHQFAGCAYRHINEPSYLMFSPWAFSFGVFMHRWLPQFLWTLIFMFGRRLP